jgi:hypothetical protein
MSRTFGEEAVEMGTRIVLFALTPRVRPSENRDYYDLIQAYKSQPEVREAAKLIAHAMKVQLCDDAFFLDSAGPIAILSPGSLFIPKLADFRGGMKVNERLGFGLLFFVVAAYVFPSADALAEDTVALGHKITDSDLTRFATDTCERLRQAMQADPHPNEKTVRGFEHLLHIRPTGKDGDQKNLTYMVRYLLEHYYNTGLFLRDTTSDNETVYFARTQYRLQVRRMVREAMPEMHRLYEQAQVLRAEGVNHG